ncbi:MAG: response regulator [Thermoplasmatota archaeon]
MSLTQAGQPTRRLLVVDDEPDILESLRDLLQAGLDHVTVETAASGAQALELLEHQHFALLVSDFKMPGMDGLELLRRAKDMAPKVPRVLMTAFPDLQIAIRAINEAAIENFFTKPLDAEEVLNKTAAILDRRQAEMHRDRAFARAMELASHGVHHDDDGADENASSKGGAA